MTAGSIKFVYRLLYVGREKFKDLVDIREVDMKEVDMKEVVMKEVDVKLEMNGNLVDN